MMPRDWERLALSAFFVSLIMLAICAVVVVIFATVWICRQIATGVGIWA